MIIVNLLLRSYISNFYMRNLCFCARNKNVMEIIVLHVSVSSHKCSEGGKNANVVKFPPIAMQYFHVP